MPAVPPELGPYRVVRPLGRGGMGTVLLAEDSRLGRLVALKAFAGPEAQSDYARQQLLREARAAATLSHPHIAGVHDVLDIDGQVVIVFEYVDGETLSKRIAQGPMVVATALQIAAQLSDGLSAAHARGIIHRDLKPSNIVITREGTAKILDFGIARIVPINEAAPTQARTTTAFVGTIGYASPEQCLGQPADARSDVFSLAVVTFEMLTGKRPFAGQDATTVLRSMLKGEPPRLSSVVPGISKPLDALIRSALAHDPAERPADARAFSERLRAVTDGKASTPMLSSRGRRWAIAALLALAIGTGGLLAALLSGPTAVGEARPPVVAVMPLTNAIGDASKDYLALGVAESLISRLASVPSITVLSRAAVFDAKSRGRDLQAVATELDVTYFVDGAVQAAGSDLRVTLTLVRNDGSVAWSDSFGAPLAGIFELQTRLASALASALQIQLSAADRAGLARQPTMSPQALDAYWRGRAFLDRRDVKGNAAAALAAFDDAVRADAQFADAHAARGEALWAAYTDTRDPAAAQAALDAGLTGLRIDPNRPNVRYSLALTLKGRGDLSQAVDELQRALALRPNYDDARRELGDALARQGRIEEAVAEFKKAIALRPNYALHHNAMGVSLLRAARYDEAAEAFRQTIALQPDNANARQNLGAAYHYLGKYDEAQANYESAIAIRPSASAYSNLGIFHHRREQFAKAAEAYRASLRLRPNSAATHRNLGDALTRMGRRSDAKASYREAMRLAEVDLTVNPKDPEALAGLAVYAAKAGDFATARTRLQAAEAIAPTDVQVMFRAAVVHALSGQTDAALNALERAVSGGYSQSTIAGEEDFASLRNIARFQTLAHPRAAQGGPSK